MREIGNGWQLRKGPNIQKELFSHTMWGEQYEILAEVFHPTIRLRYRGDGRCLLAKVFIPHKLQYPGSAPSVPQLTVKQPELWALLKADVITALQTKKSPVSQTYQEAYSALIRWIQNEAKSLQLGSKKGAPRLIGNLWHTDDSFHHVVTIQGKIQRGKKVAEEVICTFDYPYWSPFSSNARSAPVLTSKHKSWCSGLACLVVIHLELMAAFSGQRSEANYLRNVAAGLQDQEAWGKTVQQITQELLAVHPNDRSHVLAALQQTGEKLGVNLA